MLGENSEESDAISLPIDYVLAYKMDDKNGELERRAFEEVNIFYFLFATRSL